jgi:DNA-binding response OmpR family regulator
MCDMNKEKILIIDDERETPDYLGLLLEGNGFQILKAYGGADGLRVATEEHPDLILLDIMMPDVDGFEVLKKIKERSIPTRVIMVTGYRNSIPDVVRFIKAGACDYLMKPVNPEELLIATKRALALESTINLHVSDTTPIVEQLIVRAEKLEQEKANLTQQVKGIPSQDNKNVLIMMGIRLLCLVIAIGVTLLLHSLDLITRNWSFLLSMIIFILLLLPIEKVKKLSLKARKTETEIEM